MQTAYRRLALCPGTGFTAGAAAAALELSDDDTGSALEDLCGASLLHEPAPGLWRMHDLTAEHARALAEHHDDPAARQETQARVIRHYLVWTAAADRRLMPHRSRIAPAFLWPAPTPGYFTDASQEQTLTALERSLPDLLAAQALAADLGLYSMAWQFTETLRGYLTRRHDYPAWEQLCQVALNSVGRCGDPAAQARIHSLAGMHARTVGAHEAALHHHQQTLQLARTAGDRLWEAAAYEHLAALHLTQDHPEEAARVAERGLQIHRTTPESHPRGRALVQRQLGIALGRLDRHAEAYEHLTGAFGVFEFLDETYLQGRVLTNLAEIDLATAAPGQALQRLERALRLLADSAPPATGYIRYLQAAAHHQADRPQQAHQHLTQALQIYHDLGFGEQHPHVAQARHLARRLTTQIDDG